MKRILLGESVRVSDPCYDDDVWCKTKLTNVLPGEYLVEVEHSDEGGWGNRVSRLTVVHEDFEHHSHDDYQWEEHSEIGVDSGQAGVFCESSYRNDEISETIDYPQGEWNGWGGMFPKDDTPGEKWYEKMCGMTINGDGSWGSYETGVVTSSGYGDGGYPLEVMENKEGKIVGMRITYIFPEDEEEDYDDEEDMDDES